MSISARRWVWRMSVAVCVHVAVGGVALAGDVDSTWTGGGNGWAWSDTSNWDPALAMPPINAGSTVFRVTLPSGSGDVVWDESCGDGQIGELSLGTGRHVIVRDETSPGSGDVHLAITDTADLGRGVWADGGFVEFREELIGGDARLDDVVDVTDLAILAANWHTDATASWTSGDFTGDGEVDVTDLAVLAANWDSRAKGSTIPEPRLGRLRTRPSRGARSGLAALASRWTVSPSSCRRIRCGPTVRGVSRPACTPGRRRRGLCRRALRP